MGEDAVRIARGVVEDLFGVAPDGCLGLGQMTSPQQIRRPVPAAEVVGEVDVERSFPTHVGEQLRPRRFNQCRVFRFRCEPGEPVQRDDSRVVVKMAVDAQVLVERVDGQLLCDRSLHGVAR